jgi:hypothetical protein
VTVSLRPRTLAVDARSVLALAVVTLILFVLAMVMRRARGPYHLDANSDPDYAFFSRRSPRSAFRPPTSASILARPSMCSVPWRSLRDRYRARSRVAAPRVFRTPR